MNGVGRLPTLLSIWAIVNGNHVSSTALHVKLEELILPLLASEGIELVELMVSGGQRRKMVRVYVDKPDGISIDACAQLSRDIGDLFDTYDPIDGTYTLEVSSPGLTRQLKTDRDFERVIGKDIQLDVNGVGNCVGTLESVTPSSILCRINGETVQIDRVQIIKANLHFSI